MLKLIRNKIAFFSDSLTREMGLEIFARNYRAKLLSRIYINMITVCMVLFLFGCGTKNIVQLEKEYVWPLPPEQPRIKFVDIARNYEYFKKSKSEKLLNLLAGESDPLVLMRPFGVTADATGTIYVTDTSLKKVIVFDKKIGKIRYIGDRGNAKLHTPIDIIVTPENNVIVSDSFLKRVFVFDSSGEILRTIGNDKVFLSPTGIAFDAKLRLLYVVDTNKHSVLVFDENGDYKFSFGERGDAEGQFNFPTDITINENRLYVVDTFNGRIQIFDLKGNFLSAFGKFGTTPGHFSRPKGIAIDSDKNIYVTDAAFDNFQIFNQSGEVLMFVGSPGLNIGEFNLPAGIFIDSEDKIYVVDQLNSRIQIFKYITNKKEEPL